MLSRAHTPPPTFSGGSLLEEAGCWVKAEAFLEGFSRGFTLHWFPFAIWTSGSMLMSAGFGAVSSIKLM